jgi:2,4-dienoyl-CoA reductase-like NADH-dependent reductase (Old Yellow Enzyme family)
MPNVKDPLSINRIQARNRLVLPPITSCFGNADGMVTDASLGFYRQRSRDVGLVIVEATSVRADGRITPLSLGLWSDAQSKGMARLASAIKSEGSAVVVQLNHAGARSVPIDGGIRGASPSGVPFRADVQPTVMGEEQIAEFTSDFVAASVRARDAGFDGVEIHGAHFYLLSQFLSPATNRRVDRFGGDARARATFPVEVIRAIRAKLGRDFAIVVRLNAVELFDGGQTLADTTSMVSLLEDAGVDAIHSSLAASGSWTEIGGRQILESSSALGKGQPRGGAMEYAAEVKRVAKVPVIAVGKIGASEARAAVENGIADMVAIGRQMIADPETAGKILGERDDEIVLCRECGGCFASIRKGLPIACSTNHNVTGTPVYTRLSR